MSNKLARFTQPPASGRIEGLSAVLRMPRLGKIRLGIKAKSAKTGAEYPKDVDYFVCPDEVRAVYGQEPKALDVMFPCDDPSLFFPQALKRYGAGRLLCKGNGQSATCIDPKTGEMTDRSCPCEHYTRPDKPDCKAVGNLMVVLPNVSIGGAYQIDTSSTGNIIGINSAVSWIRGMLGRIAFVPLVLKRVPTQIQTPDGPTTKALLRLEFTGNIKEAAKYRNADAITMAALPPAPVEHDEDDGPVALIVDEDPPEAQEAPPAPEPPPPAPAPAPAPAAEPESAKAGTQQAPQDVIPAGKIRMLESLFRGKGLAGKVVIDNQIRDWYGVSISELPASSFEDVKARIATLPAQNEGPF